MLRHTPLHHANMKYFGIKTTLLFLPVEKCWYGCRLASIYCFLFFRVFFFFFLFRGFFFFVWNTASVCCSLYFCQCTRPWVHLAALLSLFSFLTPPLIQGVDTDTQAKKKINFINPDYYFNPLSDASRIFFFSPLSSSAQQKALNVCKFSSCLGKQKNKD